MKRNLKHALYDMTVKGKKQKEFRCEVWFGKTKDEACIKTVCSHVANMITGVTKVAEAVLGSVPLYSLFRASATG